MVTNEYLHPRRTDRQQRIPRQHREERREHGASESDSEAVPLHPVREAAHSRNRQAHQSRIYLRDVQMTQCKRLLARLERGPVTPIEACKSEHMISHATAINNKRDTNSFDLAGHVCNHLTVVEKTNFRYGSSVLWRCKCSCGKDDFLATASKLKHLKIKSCGCKTKEILRNERITHGMTDSPTWKSWKSMMDRCYLDSHKSFKDYGGRGVTVCAEWDSFGSFLSDMGIRPDGKTLDRIDVSKGYSKSNCRWATPKEQANNRRSSRLLKIGVETKTASEWAEISGISTDTLFRRLALGWPAEKAVFAPIKKQKNNRNRFGESCRVAQYSLEKDNG